jgi:hypothetical protein
VLGILGGLATVEAVETRQEAIAPARLSESAVVPEP